MKSIQNIIELANYTKHSLGLDIDEIYKFENKGTNTKYVFAKKRNKTSIPKVFIKKYSNKFIKFQDYVTNFDLTNQFIESLRKKFLIPKIYNSENIIFEDELIHIFEFNEEIWGKEQSMNPTIITDFIHQYDEYILNNATIKKIVGKYKRDIYWYLNKTQYTLKKGADEKYVNIFKKYSQPYYKNKIKFTHLIMGDLKFNNIFFSEKYNKYVLFDFDSVMKGPKQFDITFYYYCILEVTITQNNNNSIVNQTFSNRIIPIIINLIKDGEISLETLYLLLAMRQIEGQVRLDIADYILEFIKKIESKIKKLVI